MKKQKKYNQINEAERKQIAFLLGKNKSYNRIASILGRHKSTIGREIRRNSVKGEYNPEKAQHKSYVKRQNSKYEGMKIVGNKKLRKYVEKRLKKDWSPQQISGRIKKVDKHIKYASKDAIYKFIGSVYGRGFEKYLRHNGKSNSYRRNKKSKIKNRSFIEERPVIVDKKGRFGDWEGDLIVPGKDGEGVLLVLYERKAQYVLIEKIMSRKTDVINKKIYRLTGCLVCFNSLTLDNDISFRKHEEMSDLLGAPVYFCHPYHSWEKGGVENVNKLIRQYVKKGSDISKYSEEEIKGIQSKLNNRPRKGLDYETPQEVMIENDQFKKSKLLTKFRENKKQPKCCT